MDTAIRSARGKGTDAQFFEGADAKRGEMQELQQELNNVSRDKQKVAVKKVVASMMVGKDVSSLFMSMLKCMQTTDLELKKLVYLYLINCESELVVTCLPGVLA